LDERLSAGGMCCSVLQCVAVCCSVLQRDCDLRVNARLRAGGIRALELGRDEIRILDQRFGSEMKSETWKLHVEK